MPWPSLPTVRCHHAAQHRVVGGVVAGIAWLTWGALDPAAQLNAGVPDDLTLRWSPQYLLLSPVTRILDELSLLDDRQHIAVVWTAVVLAFVAALRAAMGTGTWRQRLTGASRGAILTIALLLGVYAGGALIPRPMVALVSRDPDVVLVDFHSHTERSHDGRWRFTAEDNRSWHAGAGFHAAYVTDHQSMQAWQRLAQRGTLAPSSTPVREAAILVGMRSRDNTILLPGIETVVPGAHVNLLGVSSRHDALFRHQRSLDTTQFTTIPAAQRPFAILTLPFNLDRDLARPPAIHAIEASNGAPKGIRFARTNRARIRALADSLGVPLIASSNQHGWGSTAAAWTAIRIVNWRSLEPFALDTAIRGALTSPVRDVRVVERAGLAPADAWFVHAATVPRLAWHVTTMATIPERAMTILWIAGIIAWTRRRSRTRGSRPVPSGA